METEHRDPKDLRERVDLVGSQEEWSKRIIGESSRGILDLSVRPAEAAVVEADRVAVIMEPIVTVQGVVGAAVVVSHRPMPEKAVEGVDPVSASLF